MDKLDSYTEEQLRDKLFALYPIKHLELVFEDVLPKFESGYVPENRIFSLDESVINQYISESDTVFSRDDIMEALEEIRDEIK